MKGPTRANLLACIRSKDPKIFLKIYYPIDFEKSDTRINSKLLDWYRQFKS